LKQSTLISLQLKIERCFHIVFHVICQCVELAVVPFMKQKSAVLIARLFCDGSSDGLPNRKGLGTKLTVKLTNVVLIRLEISLPCPDGPVMNIASSFQAIVSYSIDR